MEKPDAVSRFRGAERNNCAQAVLHAYAEVAGVDRTCVEKSACLGSGNAPAGECGALFAAKSLLFDARARQELHNAFTRVAGFSACREIRQAKKLTCRQCVELAANEVYSLVEAGHMLRRPAHCGEDDTVRTQNCVKR